MRVVDPICQKRKPPGISCWRLVLYSMTCQSVPIPGAYPISCKLTSSNKKRAIADWFSGTNANRTQQKTHTFGTTRKLLQQPLHDVSVAVNRLGNGLFPEEFQHFEPAIWRRERRIGNVLAIQNCLKLHTRITAQRGNGSIRKFAAM